MPDALQIDAGLSIPMSEIEIRTSRSSGPGGQHANVTDSRVEASLRIAQSRALGSDQRRRLEQRYGPVVRAVAQDGRGQARNRELALERLAGRIRDGLAVRRRRRPTRPTRASRRRRLEAKRRTSERKRDRRRPAED